MVVTVAGDPSPATPNGTQLGCTGRAGPRKDPNARHPTVVVAPMTDPAPAKLTGGQLLAAISNAIVGMLREHYGRGPMKAKTYALDDIIVCVLRDSGYSPIEKTMMDCGEPQRVVEMREDFQRVMAQRYKDTIEDLTGRTVVAFISQAHVEPDITIEVFFVDRPLDGFGAVEVVEPLRSGEKVIHMNRDKVTRLP
jgi:uncharacterized protein YbcI